MMNMDMMQGLWWILGACGVVLVIVMFRKHTEILVNFLLRMVMGVIGIYFVNQFLAAQNIAIAVGLNPASLLTVGEMCIRDRAPKRSVSAFAQEKPCGDGRQQKAYEKED